MDLPCTRRSLLEGLLAVALLPTMSCGSRSGAHTVQRRFVELVGERFDLRRGEGAFFDAGWELYLRLVHRPEARQELATAARTHIRAGLQGLAAAARGHPIDVPGCRDVRRLPLGERYVVFSDHHMTHQGHRTNFFGASGNLDIYAEVLGAYADRGYTLIENGDVEDLVFFDPDFDPDEAALRQDMSLDQVIARRLVHRKVQLDRILSDPANAAYYEALRPFAGDGRWVRLAGNHDYDLQRGAYHARLAARVPGAPPVIDVLVLEDETGRPPVVVAHGHQLDTATNPLMAPRFGETISETLGLWFEGPDRVWDWSADGVSRWVAGEVGYPGALPDGREAIGRQLREDLGRWRILRPIADAETLAALYRDVGDGLFEALFQQDIGFDYFRHHDPAVAFELEVLPGKRWFKFRLLNEQELTGWWAEAFPDASRRPRLVFGHTHEARAAAGPAYFNAGSVGRYQNLLWGVEVVDGEPVVISWSRRSLTSGPLERRVWQLRSTPEPVLVAGPPTPIGRAQC